jgi:hypothetical protein
LYGAAGAVSGSASRPVIAPIPMGPVPSLLGMFFSSVQW